MDEDQLTAQEKFELDQNAKKIEAIGRQVVREIRTNNKAMDLPVIFYKDDTICYELPDGMTTKEPPPGFSNYQPQQPSSSIAV